PKRAASMTLNRRDAVWLSVLAILLLAWYLDWSFTQTESAKLKQEIQQLRATPPQIEFVFADIRSAIGFVEQNLLITRSRHVEIELDWPSLKQVGVHPWTKVTCQFDQEAIPSSIEKMLDGKAIVIATPQGFVVRGRAANE